MTRETKLGLIVGTSFLSLAAAVAINHWKKGDDPLPEPTARSLSARHPLIKN